jgi:hypothetical protein
VARVQRSYRRLLDGITLPGMTMRDDRRRVASVARDASRPRPVNGRRSSKRPTPRGRWWFWWCVARTTAARSCGRVFQAAPSRWPHSPSSVGSSLHAGVAGATALRMVARHAALGAGGFLTHHTAAELLADLLRIRIGWTPPPAGMLHWLGLVVVWTVAPSRSAASRRDPGRAGRSLPWVVLSLVWPLMATVVPFVALSTRVSLTGAGDSNICAAGCPCGSVTVPAHAPIYG